VCPPERAKSEEKVPQIVFVSDDAIHPLTSGGRLELWGELRAFELAGVTVHLVVFHREQISDDDRRRTMALADSVQFVARRGFVRATCRHPASPYQVSSRAMPPTVVDEIVGACAGSVDAIVASHEWTLPAARRISSALGRPPIVLRSHNDEVAYYRSLAAHATGSKRIYLRIESARIRRALRHQQMWRGVAATAVISPADEHAYAGTGIPVSVVPPTFDIAPRARARPKPGRTIGFIGALDSSHTEEGLRWFVREVFSVLHEADPTTRLVVAGRRASPALTSLLRSAAGVEFLGEVGEAAEVYDRARVFVNPIFSGSGVNMKIGPAMAHGLPIVTTTIGARGLSFLLPALLVADDASSMRADLSSLLGDDDRCQKLSARGVAALRAHHPETTGRMLRDLVTTLRVGA
jgi:glycosyltransferase involved in cell wall biosynthesis